MKAFQRTETILLLIGSISVSIHFAEAQQHKRLSRIGVISGGSASTDAPYHEAFLQGLGELGHIKGKNILIEYRYAEGSRDRFTEFAAELVRLKVDVIVAAGATGIREVKKATQTIPIIMTNVSDPVALGFVSSLAKPGGNITGLSTQAPELGGKRLELLKEVFPKLSRVAVLWQPGGTGSALRVKETETMAPPLGIKLQLIEVRGPNDFDGAFAAMKKERADALVPLRSPLIGNQVKQIIDLAAKNRIPVIYDERVCGGWRPHVLWHRPSGAFSPRRQLCRQGPKGRQTRRLAYRAADKIRAGDQSENRKADPVNHSTERAGAS